MLTALLSLSRSLSLTCHNYCVRVLYVRMYCMYVCTVCTYVYIHTYVSVASINSVVLHVTYCVFSHSKTKKFLIGDSWTITVRLATWLLSFL